MITALILLDRSEPRLQNKMLFELLLNSDTVLERLVRIVLRGPFGGTVVTLLPEFADAAQEHLHGYAVHPVVVQTAASGSHAGIREGLAFAATLRARWEKAMAAAAARFPGGPENARAKKAGGKNIEDDDDESTSITGKAEFSALRGSKDVKIRGLARSFDRDGVILFRGEFPMMSLELQAQMVEAFGREGADKQATARPIAQAVYQGQRGYPVILSLDAAREVAELPAGTDFDAWLLNNLKRIQDVKTEEWGASAALRSAEEYADLCQKIKAPQ